jgi:hypothetical protein
MPSPGGRHESAIPCAPPTDPTGFIYPTYQAAQTETHTDKPSMKGSHQEVAYVSSAVGGSLYQHSPLRIPRQGTSSVLLGATVEALETG